MNYFNDPEATEFNNMRFYEEDDIDEVGEYEMEIFNPYYMYGPIESGMRSPNPSTPPGPPPSFVPSKNQASFKSTGPNAKFVDPGSIRPCLFRFVYIWQKNGRSYWAFLTHVSRRSIAGFRWMNFRWVYFGLDLNRVESFYCL